MSTRSASYQTTSALTSDRSGYSTSQASLCAIFDFGTSNLRAGFTGEESPRCVLPVPKSSVPLLQDNSDDADVVSQIVEDGNDLEDRIEKCLRVAVNRFLYLPLKGRRTVIVEPFFLSILEKRILSRVLFTYHQPKEILFLHSAFCSALALGVSSGVVLDIGTHETTAVPIYDYRPLNRMVRSTRLAGESIASRTRYLLDNFCTPSLENLTDKDVLNFMTTALVCLPQSPLAPGMPDVVPGDQLQEYHDLEQYRGKEFVWKQPSTDTEYRIPTWVRFAIPEVLFEPRSIYADSARQCIPACINTIIKQASIDLRPALKQLIITGSASTVPGLQTRIGRECGVPVLENVHGADLAWTGASLATSIGLSGPTVGIQQFNTTRYVPDWTIPINKKS